MANEATAIPCFHDINFNPTKLVTFFPGQVSFSEVTEVEEASRTFDILCLYVLCFQESLKGKILILYFHCILLRSPLM